jgi:hypothetical protein
MSDALGNPCRSALALRSQADTLHRQQTGSKCRGSLQTAVSARAAFIQHERHGKAGREQAGYKKLMFFLFNKGNPQFQLCALCCRVVFTAKCLLPRSDLPLQVPVCQQLQCKLIHGVTDMLAVLPRAPGQAICSGTQQHSSGVSFAQPSHAGAQRQYMQGWAALHVHRQLETWPSPSAMPYRSTWWAGPAGLSSPTSPATRANTWIHSAGHDAGRPDQFKYLVVSRGGGDSQTSSVEGGTCTHTYTHTELVKSPIQKGASIAGCKQAGRPPASRPASPTVQRGCRRLLPPSHAHLGFYCVMEDKHLRCVICPAKPSQERQGD